MKEIIRLSVFGLSFASILAISMYLPAKSRSAAVTLTPEQISWEGFCNARGYDPEANDSNIIDEYLDTWVGSIEEEQVFNRLPATED